MQPEERRKLRLRFRYRCGYCGVRERDVGAELTVDHFQPQSKGGLDELENWVYCWHACNEFKGDYWQPDSPQRLLHPLQDTMASHIAQEVDGRLQALSEIGAFHIERLHLNRQQLVKYRCERRCQADIQAAQAHHLEQIRELELRIQTLTEELSENQGHDAGP